MFKALGEQLDAGEAEREFFEHLEESLWTGDWLGPRGGTKKSPQAAKKRLERLLSKATEVRCMYQARLVGEGEISDWDFSRSLTEREATLVHNAWMNDVADWMNEECLAKYEELMKQEASWKGAGSAASRAHGKVGKRGGKAGGKAGKHEASAAKPADSAGKRGRKGGVSARQQAQQLKKSRFNKVINDYAANKAFFMSFVRHPCMRTVDGFRLLLTELREMKTTEAYQNLVKKSKKRTEEATRLKLERDDARFRLRQGKRDVDGHRDTPLAKKYKSGELAKTCAAAAAEYRPRKTLGAANSIGNRVHW